ncbi:TonB-dependent receptor [Exilibacterium tricleocarpae]|uniref:TonB-dependent receptor n=1 Tax=Exilibacterium tricleocarpae TaxID=2591008 RepID=A0A545TBH0_9GAMM|nr:TonB-dependent receptor [Exilibacterium tricleocarpae]TQV74544.1 TonB-dependent receptor [Exilibacterium tricleocarpae]
MHKRTDSLFKKSVLTTTVVTVVASAVNVPAVLAQDDEGFGLEEIIVTASKREKTLQDTPIAVNVTTSQDIEQAKIYELADLQTLVPTLRVNNNVFVSAQSFSIRGFASPTALGTEPSVGVFVDGVFRSRATGAISDLPKLERVEVLSGPQSTLFGKNASAGVISIVTAAPSYEPEGKVEVTLGNYDQRILKGSISAGVSDKVALSLSGGYNQRDGYTKALVAGAEDYDSKDRWNIRSQLLWEPNDHTRLRVIADYSKIDEICCASVDVVQGPLAPAIEFLGGAVLNESKAFPRKHTAAVPTRTKVVDGGISLHADLDFDGFSLTSISAYRINEVQNAGQIGDESLNTSFRIGDPGTDIKGLSQELRLTSTGDGPLDWIVGGFYFDEEASLEDGIRNGPDLRPFIDVLVGGNGDGTALVGLEGSLGLPAGSTFADGDVALYRIGQDNKDFSVFGNLDYNINESWTATLGLNYTKDKKEAFLTELQNDDLFASLGFLANGPLASLQFRPPVVEFPNVVESGKSEDSKTTYVLRLAYRLNDNMNFYVSKATGFKSSSWDLSNFSRPDINDAAALDAAGINSSNPKYGSRMSTPEYATVLEFGAKLFFRQVSLNLAVFQQTLQDFQVRSFDGVNLFQANAGETSVDGFEFDARYSPSDNWTFSLAGTYLDPIYDDFRNAPPGPGDDPSMPKDLSGTKPKNIPSTSLALGVVYNKSLENGTDFFIRADYQYESSVKLSDLDTRFERQIKNLGVSTGLFFNNNVSVQFWGRNLTDDENLVSIFGAPGQPGTISAYVNTPRTFGLSIAYEYK